MKRLAITFALVLVIFTGHTFAASLTSEQIVWLNENFPGMLGTTINTAISGGFSSDVSLGATYSVIFEGTTADAYETTLFVEDPTADRTVLLPDAGGTAILSTAGNPDAANAISGGTGTLVFEGGTADAHETSIAVTDPTADNTVTIPDDAGYVLVFENGNTQDQTIVMEGATSDAHETTLSFTDPTADVSYVFPDAAAGSYAVMGSSLTTNAPDAANSVTGTSNGILFEGATADGFETTVTTAAITQDNTITIPDVSGYPVILTNQPTQDQTLVFEGAIANEHETTLQITDPTADISYLFPDAAAGSYAVMASTLATNAPDIVNSVTGASNAVVFEGTADSFETSLSVVDPTADRAVTIPDETGTVLLTGSSPTLTGTWGFEGTIDWDADAIGEVITVDTIDVATTTPLMEFNDLRAGVNNDNVAEATVEINNSAATAYALSVVNGISSFVGPIDVDNSLDWDADTAEETFTISSTDVATTTGLLEVNDLRAGVNNDVVAEASFVVDSDGTFGAYFEDGRVAFAAAADIDIDSLIDIDFPATAGAALAVTTVDVAGAGQTAAPVLFTLANNSVEANGFAGIKVDDDRAGTEADLPVEAALTVETAGVYAAAIGDGGTTNYTAISNTGSITQAGSATLTLQDGSDLVITANADAAPFMAASGDNMIGVFDLDEDLDWDADTAGEIVTFDSTDVATTTGLVTITDLRAGVNNDVVAEASLIITPSGSHALSVTAGTSSFGDGGTTNYTAISPTGAITQAGSATLTLQDGSDFIVTANADAGPYVAVTGDAITGTIDWDADTANEVITVDSTDVATTIGIVNINDLRAGANNDVVAEASLVVDSEGSYGAFFEDGNVAFAEEADIEIEETGGSDVGTIGMAALIESTYFDIPDPGCNKGYFVVSPVQQSGGAAIVPGLEYYDDFVGDTLRDEWDCEDGGGGAAISAISAGAAYGQVELTCGTANGATAWSKLDLDDAIGDNFVPDNGNLFLEVRMSISALTVVDVELGFGDNLLNQASPGPTQYVTAQFDASNDATNWFFGGDTAALATTGDAAATGMHVYRIEVAAADGDSEFFIDGVSVMTVATATAGSNGMTPYVHVSYEDATSRTVMVDYVKVWQER